MGNKKMKFYKDCFNIKKPDDKKEFDKFCDKSHYDLLRYEPNRDGKYE